MFPLSASGSVSASGASVSTKTLLKALLERLARYEPTALSFHDDTVNFESGLLRPYSFRWVRTPNILVAISRGTLSLTKHGTRITISYELRFTEVVLGASLLSLLALSSPARLGPAFLVFWLFLVGSNYLLSVHRFEGFLRKTLKDVLNQPTSPRLHRPKEQRLSTGADRKA